MRGLFVLATIVLAVALAIIGAISQSRLFVAALIIGFGPVFWVVSHVVERLMGRELWHFSAPYPYRWMREQDENAAQPNGSQKPVDKTRHTNGGSSAPLAA